MKFEMSLRVKFDKVTKKTVEAKDMNEFKEKISEMHFWWRNRDRITVKVIDNQSSNTLK